MKTVPVEREKPVRPLGSEEIETLLKQGDDFVAVGDFVSARLVYGRVAEAHDARGALAFAATFDPIVLARIRGQRSDRRHRKGARMVRQGERSRLAWRDGPVGGAGKQRKVGKHNDGRACRRTVRRDEPGDASDVFSPGEEAAANGRNL